MARLDFSCSASACPGEVLDRVAPAGTPPPPCPVCGAPTEIAWSSPAGVDSLAEPLEYVHLDGRTERITSLHRARELERQTEAEGRPVVFRLLAQDRSNLDRNVFQHLHPQVTREKLLRQRRGRPIITGGPIEITVHEGPVGSDGD